MAHILITGGGGLIGKALCKHLQANGYEPAILSRKRQKQPGIKTFLWNPAKGEIEAEAIKNADYIVHLAGAGIGDRRWTRKRKRLILDSRIKTGELIFDEVSRQKRDLQAFISASAIGFYGMLNSEQIFIESDPPAEDFLGKTCRKWEEMADRFQEAGIRTVKIRTGIVLTHEAGTLAKMTLPIKLGFGSAYGTGRQVLPWIHVEDLCGIYLKAIEDAEMKGPYNAVAPEHLTNREFTKTLAATLKKPHFFPNIPAFIFALLFGEMSSVLLKGSRVSCDKIQAAGYKFQFPRLKEALKQLLFIKK